MQNLNTLPGAPDQSSTATRGTVEDGLKPLLGGLSDVSAVKELDEDEQFLQQSLMNVQLSSPFNAPPFVTLKEMEDSGSCEKDRRTQMPRTGLMRLG